MEKELDNTASRKFDNSDLVLRNRNNLSLTGLEQVYEVTPTRVQIMVAGSVLAVAGDNMNVTKLDVESGVIEIMGDITSLTYSQGTLKSQQKGIFKKLFK